MNPINILVVIPGIIPSVTINIINVLKILKTKQISNVKYTFTYLFSARLLRNIDIVIFCRNSSEIDLRILNEIVKKGIPYIYDIDDNFFALDSSSLIGKYHRHPISIYTLKCFIENAHTVKVYSALMKKRCLEYNKNILLHHSYFDFSLINELPLLEKTDDVIKIIYATSRQEDEQQKIIEDALLMIAKEFGNQVQIYFWGGSINNSLLSPMSNIHYITPILNYKRFIQTFKLMSFDIGLAPVYDDEFYNSKTNNKYREYGACNIAGIYSKTPLYNECIYDKLNGLLVENSSESWYEAIKLLVSNNALRKSICQNAYQDVSKNYTLENQVAIWMKILEQPFIRNKHKQILKYAVCVNFTKSLNTISQEILEILNFFSNVYIDKEDLDESYNLGYKNYIVYQKNLDIMHLREDYQYLLLVGEDCDIQTLPINVSVVCNNKFILEQGQKILELDSKKLYDDISMNNYISMMQYLNEKFFVDQLAENKSYSFRVIQKIKYICTTIKRKKNYQEVFLAMKRKIFDLYTLYKLNQKI